MAKVTPGPFRHKTDRETTRERVREQIAKGRNRGPATKQGPALPVKRIKR